MLELFKILKENPQNPQFLVGKSQIVYVYKLCSNCGIYFGFASNLEQVEAFNNKYNDCPFCKYKLQSSMLVAPAKILPKKKEDKYEFWIDSK